MKENNQTFSKLFEQILTNLSENAEECKKKILIPSFKKKYHKQSIPYIVDTFKDMEE